MRAQQPLDQPIYAAPDEPTIVGMVGALAITVLILAVIVAPMQTLTLVAIAAAVAITAGYSLRTLANKLRGQKRTLTVPGLGTVTYRVTPKRH